MSVCVPPPKLSVAPALGANDPLCVPPASSDMMPPLTLIVPLLFVVIPIEVTPVPARFVVPALLKE